MRTLSFTMLLLLVLLAIVGSVSTAGQETELTPFQRAYAHQHDPNTLITFDGLWAARQVVPAGTFLDHRGHPRETATAHLLGNAFTLGEGSLTLQFYHLFDPQTEGPMIAMIESSQQRRVRVTYDPWCGYATKIERIVIQAEPPPCLSCDWAPVPVPTPTPTPKPEPTPEPKPPAPEPKPCTRGWYRRKPCRVERPVLIYKPKKEFS